MSLPNLKLTSNSLDHSDFPENSEDLEILLGKYYQEETYEYDLTEYEKQKT